MGSFKVPEVQMDYTKLEAYTPVTEDYFSDGRFALRQRFKYATEIPHQPDDLSQFWVNSSVCRDPR